MILCKYSRCFHFGPCSVCVCKQTNWSQIAMATASGQTEGLHRQCQGGSYRCPGGREAGLCCAKPNWPGAASKPLTATPKSSSENKNGALLRHKTGGDSTSVISRVGPYWSGRLELARSPDLFAQAKPCQKSHLELVKIRNLWIEETG